MFHSATRTYSVDKMMLNLASCLVGDFQDALSDPQFCSEFNRVLRVGSVAEVRNACPTADVNLETYTFKCTQQIASLLKRYRFREDIYSDEELQAMTIESFLDNQRRVAEHSLENISAITDKILSYAATYVSKVLGPYDDATHRSLCRFGRRASVGIPARSACEAARWEPPLSGSLEQIAWFDSEMSHTDCVQEYWTSRKAVNPCNVESTYQVTSSLALTLVPKTYKALRVIMPNTTIGSYMSYGLGEMIRIALKRKGYNIKTLQQRHKLLAASASRDNSLVTADLSSASDSITVELVERLFPPDWCEILHKSRIASVRVSDNQTIESKTFCTMGIGYTFPLQTLVFLALLKAIEHFTYFVKARRTISVYGDDMIFPSQMYSNVLGCFKELGFIVNVDKTFADGPFRESCGGDYHCGVDVRPFQPRNGAADVGKHSYEAMLYKCINGLLMRWDEHEIGNTLDFLVSQVEYCSGRVKRVPQDFPDDSGVKCPSLSSYEFLRRARCAAVKYIGHGLYRFPYLRLISQEREETRHEPYLWSYLRGRIPDSPYTSDNRNLSGYSTPVQRLIDVITGVEETGHAPLITREVKPTMTFVSEMTGRRLRRTSTYLAVSQTGRYLRRSGISGFEIRR